VLGAYMKSIYGYHEFVGALISQDDLNKDKAGARGKKQMRHKHADGYQIVEVEVEV